MERAVILCDGYFGQSTGKTANGLVRYSKRYEIVGVIDHTKAGRDAGEVLDGKPNGVPIVADLKQAIAQCRPETVIIGVVHVWRLYPEGVPADDPRGDREPVERRRGVARVPQRRSGVRQARGRARRAARRCPQTATDPRLEAIH